MASSLISIFFRRNQKAGRRALALGGRARGRETEIKSDGGKEERVGFRVYSLSDWREKKGGMESIRFGGKCYSCLEYICYEDRFAYHVTSMWGPVHAPVSIPRVPEES